MKLSHLLENRLRQATKYGPDISFEQNKHGSNWMAVDYNTAGGREQMMGHGTTKNAAALDLVDQLEGLGYYSPEVLEKALAELFPASQQRDY